MDALDFNRPNIVPSRTLGFLQQGHLMPAPRGIDALYAWQVGGDGRGQTLIDLERGWTLDHQDLREHNIALLHGQILDEARPHGSAVLGTICAHNNGVGGIGIAPNVKQVAVVSYTSPEASPISALNAALSQLSFGDVLLIEAQVRLRGQLLGPLEAQPSAYALLVRANQRGVIVVASAGNGTGRAFGHAAALNMDRYRDAAGIAIFQRHVRDSGAIMVSAASQEVPHRRLPYAPYGSRIDCYAWGEGVVTCSSTPEGARTRYTHNFSGTSSAAAIIAGAALAVQSYAERRYDVRLAPHQMRQLLTPRRHRGPRLPADRSHARPAPHSPTRPACAAEKHAHPSRWSPPCAHVSARRTERLRSSTDLSLLDRGIGPF